MTTTCCNEYHPADLEFGIAEEWVEQLLETFEELQGEWETKQEEGGDDDDTGGLHYRVGERHYNPAEDLTASGTVERTWDVHRLAAFARSKGFTNITWKNVEGWLETSNYTYFIPRS